MDKPLDFDTYQEEAHKTAVYTHDRPLEYAMIALAGEVGELLNKYKKVLRGDLPLELAETHLMDETGDCLWYLAEIATLLGRSFGAVAGRNLEKLADREARDALCGDGDAR